MKITPQKFGVNFNPPRLCLIYEVNGEGMFHDFPIEIKELKRPTVEVYKILKLVNPGYLEEIDPNQIYGLIEKLKHGCFNEESKKPGLNNRLSTVDKFKGMLDEVGITITSSESSDENPVDFNAVENTFKMASDSDYD